MSENLDPLATEQAEAMRGAWTPKAVADFNALTAEGAQALWSNRHAKPAPVTECAYAVRKPSAWERLGFGRAFVPLDSFETDETDDVAAITTDSVLNLDWLDRIRVLVSGRVSVFSRIKTDVIVSRAETRSACRVLPPGAK